MAIVEKLNPWNYIQDDAIPELLKLGIASIMHREGADRKSGPAIYEMYEKGFFIIVDMWNKKEQITIRGNTILLTRNGERTQSNVRRTINHRGDSLKMRNKRAEHRRELRDIKKWFRSFRDDLKDPESILSIRKKSIDEVGYAVTRKR